MTPFKWFKNEFFLSLNTSISMIVSPNIFRQIQSQSFLAETAFCRQSSWKVSPESFPTIDMVSLAMAVLTWVRFYPAMNIALAATPVSLLQLSEQIGLPNSTRREIRGNNVLALTSETACAQTFPPGLRCQKAGVLELPLPRSLPAALVRCLLWFHCAPI